MILLKLSSRIAVRSDFRVQRLSLLAPAVVHHLNALKRRYDGIEEKLSSNTLSPKELAVLGKEYSQLSKIVRLTTERIELLSQQKELREIEQEGIKSPDDAELAEMAAAECTEINTKIEELEKEIVVALTPVDEADERGVVIEVRAGTGGDEASLFASEIFRMYQRYSVLMGWKWEDIALSKTEIGGFKEAQALVKGDSVFKRLKFEAGVHRVQRIPINDTKIQTSAASVVILPQAEELDVEIRPQDLKIDVFRAGGAGGQHVNKTESAVRMTHIPTGIVISMQDERSQHQNKERALKYLRARVYDLERRKMQSSRNELRTAAQGTGDRSDKIRTYNFPQDRISDHRIGLTVIGIDRVLSGEELPRLIDELVESDEKEKLIKFVESLESRNNN